MDPSIGPSGVCFVGGWALKSWSKELDLCPQVSDFWDIHGHGDGCTSDLETAERGVLTWRDSVGPPTFGDF